MYQLEWEKTREGTARLLGMTEMPGEVVVPGEIEGLPLTEAGPYCFAKNKYLERIVLPDTLTKIGRNAFYNCTGLKELELGKDLTELGSDAFMNCHNFHKMSVRGSAVEKSGVRLILRQISSDMLVHFLGEAGQNEAKILFSEYYESYDEVAPAHLFGRNIEGEGFRARQCFKDGVLEYARYDRTFQKACAEEDEKTLCEMAVNRLRYPVGLGGEARIQYEMYVKKHLAFICRAIIKNREMEALEFLCKSSLAERNTMEFCVGLAAESEWAEGGVFILRLKEQYFPQIKKNSRYDFDDF